MRIHSSMQTSAMKRIHNFRGRGLTLVEVLAVLVILGLLAGTLMVGFSAGFGKGKHELAKTAMMNIQSRLELYRIEHSRWPGSDAGLRALTDGHATPAAPYYLKPDQLLDPWGRQFMFVTPGPNGQPFELVTYGADGQPGGSGEDQDLSSTNLRAGESGGGA